LLFLNFKVIEEDEVAVGVMKMSKALNDNGWEKQEYFFHCLLSVAI
jgi:hypothetical protein